MMRIRAHAAAKAAFLVALAGLSVGTSAKTSTQQSLCKADETTFFSCAVGRHGKLVSLCGKGHLAGKSGWLRYRFGRPQQLELSYPKTGAGVSSFTYAHYSRYQVDRTTVSFVNGQYRYSLFDDYEGDMSPATHQQGVQVSRRESDNEPATLYCIKPAQSRLQALHGVLPCDKDDALTMGDCPSD